MAAAALGAALGWMTVALGYVFIAPISPLLEHFTRLRGIAPVLHLTSAYGFTAKEIPELKGKTFIVTGANSGLGYGSTSLLAQHGAKVIMACRSLERATAAKQKLLAAHKGVSPEQLVVLELNNSNLKSVKKFTRDFRALGLRIDGCLLNAGGIASAFELTDDGLERMFGVNHVAHHAMMKELMDLMNLESRIVTVSSVGHYSTFEEGVLLTLEGINDKKRFNAMTSYGQSKLCNILYVKELTRRLGPSSQVYCNSVHPGAVTGQFNAGLYSGTNNFASSLDAAVQKGFYWCAGCRARSAWRRPDVR
jgi:NAD(P)-dependent dehydrogenase (short-subunit alcohol dehydrogenase family)